MITAPWHTRLQFLSRIVERERRHLLLTDGRLFAQPFDARRAGELDADTDLAERVDAFLSRFGRLQDTLADKLLPNPLVALGEKPTTQIDNLDRAERLGFITSADAWFALRQLRNQMIHEYIDDPRVLADALQAGHEAVATLDLAAQAMLAEIARRGWSAG